MSNETNSIKELIDEVEDRSHVSNRNRFRFSTPDAKSDDDAKLEDNADLAGLIFLEENTGLSREQIVAIANTTSSREYESTSDFCRVGRPVSFHA